MSAIPTFAYDAARLLETGRLFPAEIEDDGWIAYHGTSGWNAGSIEREGLDGRRCPVAVDALDRVIRIFQHLGWAGEDGGGFAVLLPFSRAYDFGDNETKPIFLGETGLRGHLYATRDFAGGETQRALRRAFGDLRRFLREPELRERHFDRNRRERAELPPGCELPEHYRLPTSVDLGALTEQVEALIAIEAAATKAHCEHEAGIVYAVRLSADDLPHLKYSRMGIEARKPLPLDRLVGRVVIPAAAKHPLFAPTRDVLNLIDSGGVVARLHPHASSRVGRPRRKE